VLLATANAGEHPRVARAEIHARSEQPGASRLLMARYQNFHD
jgi:hypothetical protein